MISPDEDYQDVTASAFTAYGPVVKAGDKIISITYDVLKETKVSDLDFSLNELQLYDNDDVDLTDDFSYISYDVEITSRENPTEEPTTISPTTTEPTAEPTTIAPTKPSSKALYGDVNGDGFISVVDATIIQKYIVHAQSLTAEQQLIADVSGDNIVSVLDATAIQKYIVHSDGSGRTGELKDC